MLWRKVKKTSPDNAIETTYPYRFCDLLISDKHKQILFVPYGKLESGLYAEVDNLIIDKWPCKFQDLQTNIVEALRRFSNTSNLTKGKWPSYANSKSKTQRSYEADYVRIRLETDLNRIYGNGEAERITVSAHASPLDTTFQLTGTRHLIDTSIAQIVIDIFEACEKIRNN